MPAATVTGSQQVSYEGDQVYIGADSIVFANTADTWDTKLKQVNAIDLTPTTNASFGFTVSGGIITLVAAAGLTFRGGVKGKF